MAVAGNTALATTSAGVFTVILLMLVLLAVFTSLLALVVTVGLNVPTVFGEPDTVHCTN